VFGSTDISPEEEMQLMKQILSAPLPRESPFLLVSFFLALLQYKHDRDPHSLYRAAGAIGRRRRRRRGRRGGRGVAGGPGFRERVQLSGLPETVYTED
jgi:hypothetical protein